MNKKISNILQCKILDRHNSKFHNIINFISQICKIRLNKINTKKNNVVEFF